MAPSKEQLVQRRALKSLVSIGGYLVCSVLVGIYLDQKFFKNGVIVVVMLLLGIMKSFIEILRLVRLKK